jgi:DUF971 family protein/molybdopterin converting factor small subunit
MSEHPEPVAINLHQKSRLLAVEFSDGKRFELPCEYLRVFSRAKEVRTMDSPPVGKEQVNIESIEPQGQYAIKLIFDDGHDTGIYSWETLYELGEKHQKNWDAYLNRLEELGVERKDPDAEQKRRIKVLYFTYFVKKLGKEAEEVELPPAVQTVEKLIELQRRRKPAQAHLFNDGTFRVTVNKQFCEPFTLLEDGDEVAFVPNSPHAPVAK